MKDFDFNFDVHNLKKREDGRFRKQVKLGYSKSGAPRYKYIYAYSKTELKEKLKNLCKELNSDDSDNDTVTSDKAYTVEEWSNKWLKVYTHDLEYQTIKMYSNTIKNYIVPMIGKIYLADLKETDIQEMLNDIIDGGKKRTAQICRLTIKQIVKKAFIDGYVDKNVSENLNPIRYAADERRILSDAEIAAMKTADYTEKERIFLKILYFTGLRRGEVLALDMKDIDFEQRRIIVSKSITFIDNQTKVKSPKSKSGNREVSIPDNLYHDLKQYIKNLKSVHLFTTDDGHQIITRSSFRRMWERIIKKTKAAAPDEDISFTPHIFRHTYATKLYNANVPVKNAQVIMGHSSSKMVLDVYTHLDTRKKIESFELINKYFSDEAKEE